jgi:hypothetical protein
MVTIFWNSSDLYVNRFLESDPSFNSTYFPDYVLIDIERLPAPQTALQQKEKFVLHMDNSPISFLASERCSVSSMEDLCEIDLSPLHLLPSQERPDGPTCDQLIAEDDEFHIHHDLSRFVQRTSMGHPAFAGPNEGRRLPLRARHRTPSSSNRRGDEKSYSPLACPRNRFRSSIEIRVVPGQRIR